MSVSRTHHKEDPLAVRGMLEGRIVFVLSRAAGTGRL